MSLSIIKVLQTFLFSPVPSGVFFNEVSSHQQLSHEALAYRRLKGSRNLFNVLLLLLSFYIQSVQLFQRTGPHQQNELNKHHKDMSVMHNQIFIANKCQSVQERWIWRWSLFQWSFHCRAGVRVHDRCQHLHRDTVRMNMNDNHWRHIGKAPSPTGCTVNHLLTG